MLIGTEMDLPSAGPGLQPEGWTLLGKPREAGIRHRVNSDGLPGLQLLHCAAQSQGKAVITGKDLGSQLQPLRLRQQMASVC